MAVFSIDPEVFERLPGVCFGAVAARGIDNTAQRPEIGRLLDDAIDSARARLEGVNLKEYPQIAMYREAFQRLGMNPNKYMSSIEALCKRVAKGTPFPKINPIVDIGNAMSLRYILPMGAHDIRKLAGDLTVRFARPEDHFLPFGETAQEKPDHRRLPRPKRPGRARCRRRAVRPARKAVRLQNGFGPADARVPISGAVIPETARAGLRGCGLLTMSVFSNIMNTFMGE